MPVSTANHLLDADFSVFTHPATGKQTIRTLSYSIPSNLAKHLSLVHPTVSCVLFLPYAGSLPNACFEIP